MGSGARSVHRQGLAKDSIGKDCTTSIEEDCKRTDLAVYTVLVLTLALLCTITQASGEGDQLGDLSTISDPSIIDHIMQVVKKA
jgi:hypothetical protein